MAKLIDSHLVILSAAAEREGGAVLPLPESLAIKGAAAAKTLEGLCKKGLLDETSAPPDMAFWREAEDGKRMMLIITEAGMRAIKDGAETEKKSALKNRRSTKRGGGAARPRTAAKSENVPRPPAVRKGTKQALLIDLLKRKKGATIDVAVKATGWQPHTVRGAISGALKKKLGLIVNAEAVDGRGRVYRIIERG